MFDESKHFPVEGRATAATGGNSSTAGWWSTYVGLFEAVPDGLTLTVTDVCLDPEEGVTFPHRVMLADGFPEGGEIPFFELRAQPHSTQQVHFQTGYVIQASHKVTTYILPNPTSLQFVQVYLTGYVPKPWVWWWTKAKPGLRRPPQSPSEMLMAGPA